MSVVTQSILNPSLDLNFRFSFSHPHLLKTFGFSPPKNMNQHSNKTMNQIFFESSDVTLQKLIEKRKPNKLFTEPDILAILRGLCSVLAYLQSKGVNHGDLEPSTVFFDTAKGCFKINDQELLRGKNSGFYFLKQNKKFSFLAPESIEEFRRGDVVALINTNYKSEVFALGLTILEAATLMPSQEIYDFEQGMMIKADKVDDRLIFIKNHYSGELTHVLRMMLEYDPDVRPDCLELFEIINVSKDAIKEEKASEYNATTLKKNASLSKKHKSRSLYSSQEILPQSIEKVYENTNIRTENHNQTAKVNKELSKSIYLENSNYFQHSNQPGNDNLRLFPNLVNEPPPNQNTLLYQNQIPSNNIFFAKKNFIQSNEPLKGYEASTIKQNLEISPEKKKYGAQTDSTPNHRGFTLNVQTAGPKYENFNENQRYQTVVKEKEALFKGNHNNFTNHYDPSAIRTNQNNINNPYMNFAGSSNVDNLANNFQNLNLNLNNGQTILSPQQSPSMQTLSATANNGPFQNQSATLYLQNGKVLYSSNEINQSDKKNLTNEQRANAFSETVKNNNNPNFYNLESQRNITQTVLTNRINLLTNQDNSGVDFRNVRNVVDYKSNFNGNFISQRDFNSYGQIIEKNKKLEKRIDEILKKSKSLTQALNVQNKLSQN